MSRPIVTMLSDFGTADYYVSAMKGVLLRVSKDIVVIDVTHEVPRHDVVAGSFLLERAVASFDKGTTHLAVVDPGVGSARRLLLARVRNQVVVCPDNGLITWTVRRHSPAVFGELIAEKVRANAGDGGESVISATFHGRDLFAPAAGLLACGIDAAEISRSIADPVLLDIHLSRGPKGQILHIDHFGNCTTNIAADVALRAGNVVAGLYHLGAVRRTYSDVRAGEPLALIGSSELLEIAVNAGSAANDLDLKVGDVVELQ